MKYTHTEGPGSILKPRFARGVFPLVAALFACALAAPSARAEVLVYEGFHSQDYTTTATATAFKEKKPTGHNIGFSSDHAWSANTAVPKTIAGSLTLGASFDISETNGTGRAIMSNDGTEGKGRGIYRKFTASMPTGGSVYFRFLMKLNSNASDYIGALQSGGYWAGGFIQNTFSGGSDDIQSLTTDGIWMGYKKVGKAISLFGRIGSTDYEFPYTTSDSTLGTWSTYIFIARVDIGKGTDGKDLVSLAVQPIATGSYSLEWDWTVKNVEANIVSGSTPVSYIAFAGQYQTKSKEVAIDQFKIATSLSEVCNHAAETQPEIGAISLTRTGAAEYSLSADEDANAADIAWIANDGASATTNDWQSVAEGGTANWTISSLTVDKTYAISVLATNENGTAEVAAGSLYTGELALGATTDADESGLVSGGVTVARANADPFPLTVNYTITGSAGTEGTTWTAPVAVTIPANATSAVLPVVPLRDDTVTEDVAITASLASGNYELPASNNAALTLVNHHVAGPTDFAKKMTLTPSTSALTKIGESTFTDFPVLVRLPADASALLQSAGGTDLLVTDESGNALAFEVEAFDPDGETLVWVKVPSLSSATELTVYFGGAANIDNDPAAVWSSYAVVIHGGDAISNAVAGGPAVTAGSTDVTPHSEAGRIGGGIRKSSRNSIGVNVANPSSKLVNGRKFSVSAWFKHDGDSTHILGGSQSSWGSTGFLWLLEQGTYVSVAAPGSHQWSNGTGTLPKGDWGHVAFAYDHGVSLKSYLNGVSDRTKNSPGNLTGSSTYWTFGSYMNKASGDSFKGDMDELRVFDGVASGDWIALEYATMADADFFGMGEIESVDPTAQVFSTPTVVRNANGTYTVTVVLSENSGDVGVTYDADTTAVTNILATAAIPGTYTDTPINLTGDTTYKFAAYGKNANDTEVVAKGGIFYNGDISIEKISDAVENGLVTGVFRISRADTAHDLAVAYTVSGTAAAGQTYAALSGTATIPAGSTSVDVEVVPLLDAATTEDKTVALTLATGLYGINAQAGSAEMTVVNLVVPTGFNTWVAPADGLASVDSNWSAGHAPLDTEQVLFDGRFSTANCEWDSAASATVASWTQTNGYTGTVTFDTEFPDYSGATFPLFTISGDCVIASGKWSCRGNYNNYGAEKPSYTYKTDKRWCLNVAVGGAMQVASGASITATGRGFGFPNDSSSASKSYGGYAYGGGTSPYGSIKEPFDPGMGARAQGDQNGRISAIGGGAIKIAVTGALTLDGSIVALGTADQNIARAGGTGGSIWISASQIAGAGKIDASAPTGIGNDQIVGTGSGGRIALYTQSPIVFPIDNVACSGTGYRGTSWSWNSRVSGPGTIYVKDPTQSHGTLYVKQSTTVSTQNSKWTGTPVMGDLALDAVVLSGRTFLRIPEGASLTLPSLAAVTTDNTGAGQAGLVYDGGTLNIGSGSQTLKANVAFSSPTAFSFPGDLTLETGAKLGSLNSMYGTAANDYDQTFTVSVAGNLTIPAGASAGATRCCALTASGKARYAASHGGQSLYLAAEARTNGFDSVLNPSMPGGSANSNFPAGGAFTLTVGGTLTLDGPMTADGGGARGSDSTYDGTSAGAGGTLNITAGALAGEGKMSAEGGCGRWNYAGGAGGGRIAVRLTGNGSTFSDYWKTNITAYGESFSGGNGKASSAGTVYLQEKSAGEAAGTVVVRNDLAIRAAAANNNAVTLYPGNGDGCDAPSALKKTRLLIDGASRVELTDDLRLIELTMASDTALDLNGKTLVVNKATLGGVKLASGTYAAGDEAVSDCLVDTATGGKLVVTGGGFSIIVR